MTLFEVSNTFSSGNREYLETLNQNSYEHNGSYEVLFISVLVKTYSLTKLCHVYLYLPKLRMLDWNNLIITFFVKNCNLHDVCENEKVINFGNFEKKITVLVSCSDEFWPIWLRINLILCWGWSFMKLNPTNVQFTSVDRFWMCSLWEQ